MRCARFLSVAYQRSVVPPIPFGSDQSVFVFKIKKQFLSIPNVNKPNNNKKKRYFLCFGLKTYTMDKLRKALSGQDSRDNDSSTGILPNVNQMSSLEWSTRIKGFIACFVIGIFFSLMGATALVLPLRRKMAVFGIFYTLGNITSLLSTCFLMGPVKQIKKMFSSSRIIATIVALAMIVFTLIAAIGMKNAPLTFLCIIFQFIALTWYSLSYIPYARDAIKSSMSHIIA